MNGKFCIKANICLYHSLEVDQFSHSNAIQQLILTKTEQLWFLTDFRVNAIRPEQFCEMTTLTLENDNHKSENFPLKVGFKNLVFKS